MSDRGFYLWIGIPLSAVALVFGVWHGGIYAIDAAAGMYVAMRVAEYLNTNSPGAK